MLESYRRVVANAETMLDQARAGRWDQVALTAKAIGRLTTALDEARRDRPAPPPAEEAERIRLLARLVRIDAEVRQLRQPWARRLDALLDVRPRDRSESTGRPSEEATSGPC